MQRIPSRRLYRAAVLLSAVVAGLVSAQSAEDPPPLTLSWAKNYLTIHGARLPGGQLRIHYLEAYCRPGSTDRDWRETVIKHQTELLEQSANGRSLKLRCTLADGVVVLHDIVAGADEVTFR